jgi:hypothetical protein
MPPRHVRSGFSSGEERASRFPAGVSHLPRCRISIPQWTMSIEFQAVAPATPFLKQENTGLCTIAHALPEAASARRFTSRSPCFRPLTSLPGTFSPVRCEALHISRGVPRSMMCRYL